MEGGGLGHGAVGEDLRERGAFAGEDGGGPGGVEDGEERVAGGHREVVVEGDAPAPAQVGAGAQSGAERTEQVAGAGRGGRGAGGR